MKNTSKQPRDLVKFEILGDNDYRKTGNHPARIATGDGKEIYFTINAQQLLDELKREFLISENVKLLK